MNAREEIYGQIGEERARQDEQWGGAAHDDRHSIATWLLILMKHFGYLSNVSLDWSSGAPGDASLADFRRRLIVVAALCVAVVEAMDRAGRSE